MVAKQRNGGLIARKVNIYMSLASMHALAGYFARTASDASANIDIYRHLIPPGYLAGRNLELRYPRLRIGKVRS